MTQLLSAWLGPSIAAIVGAYLAVRLIEKQSAALRLIDLPNIRSSHKTPRPRGGGLGVVAAVGLGLLVGTVGGARLTSEVWTVLAAAIAVSALGLWDDVRSLSVSPRLLVQTLVASAMVAVLGGLDRLPLPAPLDLALGAAGFPLAVVWLVGVTNFFNFMDGVDGFAGGQAVVTLAALAIVLAPMPSAGLALVTIAATAGFLPRNWSPARIFLGDIGSGFLGFLMAALPFVTPSGLRERLVLLVATSLTLFLLDPVATLIVRARKGARVGAAHREHAYQRLIPPDRLHAPGVIALLLTSVALSIAAAIAYRNPAMGWPSLGLALLAFSIEWWLAGRRRNR